MCVFKYHAFIYFLRPPPWYGTPIYVYLYLLWWGSSFGLDNMLYTDLTQGRCIPYFITYCTLIDFASPTAGFRSDSTVTSLSVCIMQTFYSQPDDGFFFGNIYCLWPCQLIFCTPQLKLCEETGNVWTAFSSQICSKNSFLPVNCYYSVWPVLAQNLPG